MTQEAKRIKASLRSCQTAAEIHAVADAERPAVIAMSKESEDGKTQAIQIANLKAFRLSELR